MNQIEAAAVRVGEAARLMGMSEPAVRQMIYRAVSTPTVAAPTTPSDDHGNRRRRGRKVTEMIETAPPVTTGRPIPNFPLLTEAMGGLRGITVIGGPTGHGKSRLAANIVASIGGPSLPVLYLDLENDDQVDREGRPITRTVGDWIISAYGRECPVLTKLYGYHSFDDLEADIPTFNPPALIVIDTVQSLVGQSGENMRTDLVARQEWAKEQVRHGYLVLLLSQVNGMGAFRESGALAEGGWSNLKISKSGDTIEVRVEKTRNRALPASGVVMRLTGARLTELHSLGTPAKAERSPRLTPIQRAITGAGGRIEFAPLMRACGYSLKRDSASRKQGLRALAAAVEAVEIGRPEPGIYTFPPQPDAGDKSGDIVSQHRVPTSPRATSQEDTTSGA